MLVVGVHGQSRSYASLGNEHCTALHHYPYDGNDKNPLSDKSRACHHALHRAVEALGQEVEHISDVHNHHRYARGLNRGYYVLCAEVRCYAVNHIEAQVVVLNAKFWCLLCRGEEQPSEGYDVQRDKRSTEAHDGVHLCARLLCPGYNLEPYLVQRKCQAVEYAPRHIAYANAMPQASEYHREQQVYICAERTVAVTSEGYVQIILEPCREGYVPASPELGYGCRLIWRIEVVGQAETHHKCHAHSDIGVTREVAIYLHCKAVDSQERHNATIAQLPFEGRVYKQRTERRGYNGIFY